MPNKFWIVAFNADDSRVWLMHKTMCVVSANRSDVEPFARSFNVELHWAEQMDINAAEPWGPGDALNEIEDAAGGEMIAPYNPNV